FFYNFISSKLYKYILQIQVPLPPDLDWYRSNFVQYNMSFQGLSLSNQWANWYTSFHVILDGMPCNASNLDCIYCLIFTFPFNLFSSVKCHIPLLLYTLITQKIEKDSNFSFCSDKHRNRRKGIFLIFITFSVILDGVDQCANQYIGAHFIGGKTVHSLFEVTFLLLVLYIRVLASRGVGNSENGDHYSLAKQSTSNSAKCSLLSSQPKLVKEVSVSKRVKDFGPDVETYCDENGLVRVNRVKG
ncbi:unnamed protein product, partial [Musa banksii]